MLARMTLAGHSSSEFGVCEEQRWAVISLTTAQKHCLLPAMPTSARGPRPQAADGTIPPGGIPNIDATKNILVVRRASTLRQYKSRWGEAPALWAECFDAMRRRSLLPNVCKTNALTLLVEFAGFGAPLQLFSCRKDLLLGDSFVNALRPVFRRRYDIADLMPYYVIKHNFGNVSDQAAWWGCWGALGWLLEAGVRPVWVRIAVWHASAARPSLLPKLLAGTDSNRVREDIFFDAVADASGVVCRAMISSWPKLLHCRDLRYWPRRTAEEIAMAAGEMSLAHWLHQQSNIERCGEIVF